MRSSVLCLSVGVVLLAVSTAQASFSVLTSGLDKVTYDSTANAYWYWNLADTTNETYAQQVTFATGLNAGSGYFGLTNWHMASATEMTGLWTNPAADIGGSFNPTQDTGPEMWDGRYNDVSFPFPGDGWHLNANVTLKGSSYWSQAPLGTSAVSDLTAFEWAGAWITASETPTAAPVPLPGALLLGCLGASWAGWWFRRSSKTT
jgi:hypothetical protein